MLGKLEKNLDESIRELKMLKQKVPFDLNDLSVIDIRHIHFIFDIIDGLEIPERLGNLNE
jgi:hypothetical protein